MNQIANRDLLEAEHEILRLQQIISQQADYVAILLRRLDRAIEPPELDSEMHGHLAATRHKLDEAARRFAPLDPL